MRTTFIMLLVIFSVTFSKAQHSGFQTLHNKFAGEENVFTISTSGFFARAVLWISGEHEFTQAVKDINQIRLITIPKAEFAKQAVTVNGYKKLLRKDSYELLADVKDHGDDVSLFIQSGKRDRNNRYLLLVENESEVVAIEIKGYIDPQIMLNKSKLSYN